jgi:hypothetical protein
MKQSLFVALFFSFYAMVTAQKSDPWYSFYDQDTTYIGFKDKSGNIKIEPKFMGLTYVNKFDDIVAVMTEKEDGYESYYLTKTGKITGISSMFTFDNTFDCESEGYIRFTNHETEQMGLFNANGEIAVPAEYNYITPVHNGLLVVLKGALKINENHSHEGCNHFSWSGGTKYLIDTSNKILIENFNYDTELNLYSLQITKTPPTDEIWDSFLGADGQYYSFINYEKEFIFWLRNNMHSNLSLNTILENSLDKITYWKNSGDWIYESKQIVIQRNFKFIKQKLQEIKSEAVEYFIMNDGLYLSIPQDNQHEKYFNNCYRHLEEKYPVKNIVISQKNKKDTRQDNLLFLRTDDGYKLIGMSAAKNNLK